MARWLIVLIFFSTTLAATPKIYLLLSQAHNQSAMLIMKQLEKSNLGMITEFDAVEQEGILHYNFWLLNAGGNKWLYYSYRASDGQLLEQETIDSQQTDDCSLAIVAMKKSQMRFSTLVQQVAQQNTGYLVKAMIDNALGINYLTLEFLTAKGRQQLAYNINSQHLLPLQK